VTASLVLFLLAADAPSLAAPGLSGLNLSEASHRMKYRLFREHGFPIGSGAVEGAHKHALQCRRKRAGQRWQLHDARRMAHLRGLPDRLVRAKPLMPAASGYVGRTDRADVAASACGATLRSPTFFAPMTHPAPPFPGRRGPSPRHC
jgi:hypothetical protein